MAGRQTHGGTSIMPVNSPKPSNLDLPHIFRAAVELGCAHAALNTAAVDKSAAGARLDKAYDKLARALQIADDSENYFDQWFRLGKAAKCSKEQIAALRRLTFAFWTLNGQARYQPAGKTKRKRRPASDGLRLLEN